jgi:2'-5' RNA ligase
VDYRVAADHVRDCVSNWSPFDITLGEIRIFPVTNVIYVELAQGAPDMYRIHDAMNSASLAFEEPFAYHPHVTVAQEICDADVADAARRAKEMWDAYPGPRTFRAERTAFVQNTLMNSWIDLAEHDLGAIRV